MEKIKVKKNTLIFKMYQKKMAALSYYLFKSSKCICCSGKIVLIKQIIFKTQNTRVKGLKITCDDTQLAISINENQSLIAINIINNNQ